MTMTAPDPSAGAAPDQAPAGDLKLRLTPEERRQRMLVGVYLGLAAFVFVFFALDPDSASDATFNLSMPQDRFSLSWTFEPRLIAIIVWLSAWPLCGSCCMTSTGRVAYPTTSS